MLVEWASEALFVKFESRDSLGSLLADRISGRCTNLAMRRITFVYWSGRRVEPQCICSTSHIHSTARLYRTQTRTHSSIYG